MAPGAKPGERRGGRVKGQPNRKTLEFQALLDRMKCDPRKVMALIVLNELPCGVCRGKGRTKYAMPVGEGEEPKIRERVCQSCYGTKMESCNPELRGKMAAEMTQYLQPKRKAIEYTGEGGGPIQSTHRIVFVDAKTKA